MGGFYQNRSHLGNVTLSNYDHRGILSPLVDYIQTVNHDEFSGLLITIVIPEFAPFNSSARILHNQTANLMRRHLQEREDVIVTDVPYHIPGIDQRTQERPLPADAPNQP